MTIRESLESFKPYNEQEEKDAELFKKSINDFNDILTRENEYCHVCSSAFITNKERTKVLCAYHKIYDSWTWTGGHVDGDDNLEYVAEKEAYEETGIQNLKLLYKQPISVDTLPVPGHFKRGKFVPAHIHLSFAYLYEANEHEKIQIKEDENRWVVWLTYKELIKKSTEPYMINVYKKIIAKIKEFNL